MVLAGFVSLKAQAIPFHVSDLVLKRGVVGETWGDGTRTGENQNVRYSSTMKYDLLSIVLSSIKRTYNDKIS